MVEMLNTTQIYRLQHHDHEIHHEHYASCAIKNNNNKKQQRQNSKNNNNNSKGNKFEKINGQPVTTTTATKCSEGGNSINSGVLSDFFASLSSIQSIKSPTHYIEKFINLDLLSNYETLRLSNKYFPHSSSVSTKSQQTLESTAAPTSNAEGLWHEFNCLQGIQRNNKCNTDTDAETADVYEAVRFNSNMINKCPTTAAAATLQNFQKLPECDQEQLPKDTANSGPTSSSSELNSDNSAIVFHRSQLSQTNNKRLPIDRNLENGSVKIYVDACPAYSTQLPQNSNESASENSSSSIAATTTTTYSSSTVQRTSSASSSGDCQYPVNVPVATQTGKSNFYLPDTGAADRLQRRKLMQIIAGLDQQNKSLQRELARERRRRNEELARVVKSLLCFESKLKSDMKSVNQRMQEKDVEICRLTRQNRALKKALVKVQKLRQAADEGVIADDIMQTDLAQKLGFNENWQAQELEENLLEDCLVLEALQCINCRKQFYDIGIKEGWTQTNSLMDGSRTHDDHTTEHGSSSDDTVSSSFYGARRSVRYTSKRTSGTFRDYMRSRAMHVDDTMLADCGNWENTSTLSRDSHTSTSNEKLNYSTLNKTRNEDSPPRNTNNKRKLSIASDAAEEDDGIFSPTQDDDDDDDFEEDTMQNTIIAAVNNCVKNTTTTATTPEFSEASPKQIYETSVDDWYASGSDQEDLADGRSTKCYTLAAVNPVLECVNQILLQQAMEESVIEDNNNEIKEIKPANTATVVTAATTITATTTTITTNNLPRRSSLSGRRQDRINNSELTNSQCNNDGDILTTTSASDTMVTTTTNAGGTLTGTRNKTLTRKRVHFSTKNSMVHLPRHESDNEELEQQQQQQQQLDNNIYKQTHTIPINLRQQQQQQQQCYGTRYFATITTPAQATMIKIAAAPTPNAMPLIMQEATDSRLDTLNYESIYSNEYEPIGSEHNSSNLYVEMETERLKSTDKQKSLNDRNNSINNSNNNKLGKIPPALPPKPANLIKFKKSLLQLTELREEQNSNASEPDYCSISEVNVGMTSVQIVADVHKAPESVLSGNDLELTYAVNDMDTVNSDETCAASQKTEEIEEIFADIPKLPNVAAIIAPKQSKYIQQQQQHHQQNNNKLLNLSASNSKTMLSDYLSMTPKSPKFQTVQNLLINTSNETPDKLVMGNTHKVIITNGSNTRLNSNKNKHRHNKNNNCNSSSVGSCSTTKISSAAGLLKDLETVGGTLPLQEEFDWYNLDAEYGKAKMNLNMNDHKVQNGSILAEIHEDHEQEQERENYVTAADEYNLDEEFDADINVDKAENNNKNCNDIASNKNKHELHNELNAVFRENVLSHHKTRKLHNNLDTFEKFIEGSGLSTKPLPHKRKIYFAGPFV